MKEIPTNLKREAIERKDSINLSWYQQDVFSGAENFLKSGEFPQELRIFSKPENILLRIFSKVENFFKS